MKVIYTAVIVILVGLMACTFTFTVVGASPTDEALAFLSDVRQGSLAKSVRHFGGNACRCPAKGGWGSYLVYVSAQEPNLAFITGHPFRTGKPKEIRMKNKKEALLPWQKPEDFAVDVPIEFDPAVYAPLFLPLSMAYGHEMKESEVLEFLKDPDKDAWKGLTLRLRPSLNAGAIAPPAEPLPPEAKEEFKVLEQDDSASTEEAIKEALGEKAAQFITPRDAGQVRKEDGTVIASTLLENQLPRLKSAILRLHVVRRGQINDWTIYHFGLMAPVLRMSDGHDLPLIHDRRPGARE